MLWIWAINLHGAGSECLLRSISGSLYCKLGQFSREIFQFRQMSSISSKKARLIIIFVVFFVCKSMYYIQGVAEKKYWSESQFHKYMWLFRTNLDLFGPFCLFVWSIIVIWICEPKISERYFLGYPVYSHSGWGSCPSSVFCLGVFSPVLKCMHENSPDFLTNSTIPMTHKYKNCLGDDSWLPVIPEIRSNRQKLTKQKPC